MPYLNTLQCRTLANFLASPARPPCTMSLHEVRGFLWGVASAPQPTDDDDWMPFVFDGDHPGFRDAREETQVVGLLGQLMDETIERMESGETPFPDDPGYEWHADAAARAPLTAWCLGLLKAHVWLEEHWGRLLALVEPVTTEDGVFDINEEVAMTLDMASLLADVETALVEDEDPQALWQALPDMVGQMPWIMMNYAECGGLLYELAEAGQGIPPPGNEPSWRQDDPCFCGSGRRYGACCGQAANDD